jgi:signal transduction histidine kinase
VNLTADPTILVLHELRAPLGLMATAARAAADDCTDDDIRQRCEMIVRAAERMLRTTHEVFELTRASRADHCEPYRPLEVAQDIVATLRGLNVNARLTAFADTQTVECIGVRARFEALLHSLITNSLDHSDAGAEVTVTFERGGGGITATVANPVGASKRHRGLGLGAELTRELADQLGGTLVRRCDGRRYVVTVTLPISASGA